MVRVRAGYRAYSLKYIYVERGAVLMLLCAARAAVEDDPGKMKDCQWFRLQRSLHLRHARSLLVYFLCKHYHRCCCCCCCCNLDLGLYPSQYCPCRFLGVFELVHAHMVGPSDNYLSTLLHALNASRAPRKSPRSTSNAACVGVLTPYFEQADVSDVPR